MDSTVEASVAPAVRTNAPFELEHLLWSMEGSVARTDNLAVAQAAEKKFFEAKKALVEAQALGNGVYRFVYARLYIGGFVWGTQVTLEDVTDLYYFAITDQPLPYVLVTDEGEVAFRGSFEEAEAQHREWDSVYKLLPSLM